MGKRGQPLGHLRFNTLVYQLVIHVLDEQALLTQMFLSLQHPLELLARRGGSAVPLLLAAHLHSCSALIHD